MTAVKIRKDDTVVVLSGKDRGKRGKVERVSPLEGSLVVAGVNLVKKHAKKSSKNTQGGRIEFPAPLMISKVMLVCPSCGKPTRISFENEGGSKIRVCKKCGKPIGVKNA